ncbi:MAG TPA: hypothetical protein VJI46_05680 [Candidatus Nanoarchaeia archaeon]|nr:hypothetical protein [Candidatus Nanoarchaeia archaeon]
MVKKAEITTVAAVTIATILLLAGAYLSITSVDKNIRYIGDSRINVAYQTKNCINSIGKIPIGSRVAFESLDEISKEGYLLSEGC